MIKANKNHKPYKNLTVLKAHLNIAPINTGERFMRLGFEYTTDEGLHAMTSADGSCVHLRSRVEWELDEYRGQVQDYGSCLSGLDRCKTVFEELTTLCEKVA